MRVLARCFCCIAGLVIFGGSSVAAAPASLTATQLTGLSLTPPVPSFSDAERARIVQYWNAPGRYEVGARPGSEKNGPFVVRLTSEASIWFRAYSRLQKPGPTPPTDNPLNAAPSTDPWELWVTAKLKYDRALAQQQTDSTNAQLLQTASTRSGSALTASPQPLPPLPPHPGPMPTELLMAIGNAPSFAACVAPLRHTVRFDTGESLSYTTHVTTSNPRYPYYRFDQGVTAVGIPLSRMLPEHLERIFGASGMTLSEQRVTRAVSQMEGGFEAVNTYDTGFLSVGFIQFATLEGGSGTLGAVMQYEKSHYPPDFERDFRAFGIDVNPKGALVVLDPSTGAELTANQAVLKIIEDKRLVAVFQLAGSRSIAFRAAQVQIAKEIYYPANLQFSFVLNGKTFTGRVGDIVHSEAGLATLMDRKVNIGNIRLLNDVLAQTMKKYGLTRLEDLSRYEREIIRPLKWRRDFLKDDTLTQPFE
jgi:hypothetical protein